MSWQAGRGAVRIGAVRVGASRPGYDSNEHIISLLGQLAKDALTLVEIPALAISSTDCRHAPSSPAGLGLLMPDGVVRLRAGSTVAPATRARSTTSLVAGMWPMTANREAIDMARVAPARPPPSSPG